jgi:chemotaxis protein methyltransferase CheR
MNKSDASDEAAFGSLLIAIEARYGFDLRDYSMPSLSRRISAFCERFNISDIKLLEERLLDDHTFFGALLDFVLIRVTEFFRDPRFYSVFRERVVPVLRTYPRLRIWHAGCASGEEVYSIAILLAEEGLYERAQLYGTDLSADAIERAKEGIYPARSTPKFTANYQKAGGAESFSDYYHAAYDHIVVKEALKKNIVFFQHDLVSDQVFGEMHVVLCRNVLIYFGADLKTRVVEKLVQALCRGGFLCLGSSEALPSQSAGRMTEVAPRERIFRHTES